MDQRPQRGRFDRYPMLWLGLSFAVGILAANSLDFGLPVALGTALVAGATAIVFHRRRWASGLVAVAFIFAGAGTLTADKLSVRADRLKVFYDEAKLVSGTPVEIEGILAGAPEASFDGEFLTLRPQAIRYRGTQRVVSGNVRVFVPTARDLTSEITAPNNEPSVGRKATSRSHLKYGSRVRVACALEREDEYLNPGVQARREVLDRQNIDASCSVKSRLLIEHNADESVFLPLAWVYDQRAALIDDFRNHLSPSAAGVMIASLLGDKYFLDKETADLFREGGTFHILVISGLHITFIGGLLLLFVRRVTRNRWIQLVITAAVLWAYTLAVGADIPVVRAAVMFTVFLIGYAIYRHGSLLNALGICLLILLVWRPGDLLNPSFQLTFVSVSAIILLAYPLIEHLRKIGSWTPTPTEPFPPNVPAWLRTACHQLYWNGSAWEVESKRNIWTGSLRKERLNTDRMGDFAKNAIKYLFEAILVSTVVQISMLPLSVIYFHRVPVSGVILNLWVGVLIAIESFAAVAGVVVARFSELLALPLFRLADAANWLMLAVPRLFSGMEWLSFRVPAYSGDGRLVYVIFFMVLTLFAVVLARWNPFNLRLPNRFWLRWGIPAMACTLATGMLVIVLHPFSSPRPDGRLHIDFLDVGQGDSALVTFPNGETWLVDGGGRTNYRSTDDEETDFIPDRRSIGESVVSEVLWAKGYSRIDRIVGTHADADHIQGLADVAENFSIGSAILGRAPADDAELGPLLQVLSRRGVPVEISGRGDRFDVGGATVEILYPLKTDIGGPSDNDHSVVIRMVFGNRAFLMTGDIEKAAEANLLSNGGTLATDIVKVPHHGSRTSSTSDFVKATLPQIAVISVGKRSPFGHPHSEVVERWQNAGVQVLTTGENGMISVSTDGKDLQLSKFAP